MPAENLYSLRKVIGESDYTPGLYFFTEIDGDTAVSKGGNRNGGKIQSFPLNIMGKSVTSIGSYALAIAVV